MSKEVETMIIGAILHVQEYANKVYPSMKPELFEHESLSAISKLILEYQQKYSEIPGRESLSVELANAKGLSETGFQEAKTVLNKVFEDGFVTGIKKQNLEWMLDKTEKQFKDRACFLAIMQSMSIIDGENKKLTREAIPDILKDALNISFDNAIGHDYIEDFERRFEFYHNIEQKIPFALTMMNKVTNNGCPRKSLIVPVAPTGVGKSLFMTDWSAFLLMKGFNVLYITLELAEERIGERIDAKLLDVSIQDLKTYPKKTFDTKINQLKSKTAGKLIIKEHSPGTFNANHLRFLLQDLKTKKSFTPDVIMVDYLNLMSSYRMKDPGTYSYIKAVAEEIRGVAMQHDCIVCAPTQTNRNGMGAADYDLTDIAESAGVSMTADLVFGFISTPELESMQQMRCKQLKNRFGDLASPNSFMVGVNRAKMTLFDLDLMQGSKATTTEHKQTPMKLAKKPVGFKFEEDE